MSQRGSTLICNLLSLFCYRFTCLFGPQKFHHTSSYFIFSAHCSTSDSPSPPFQLYKYPCEQFLLLKYLYYKIKSLFLTLPLSLEITTHFDKIRLIYPSICKDFILCQLGHIKCPSQTKIFFLYLSFDLRLFITYPVSLFSNLSVNPPSSTSEHSSTYIPFSNYLRC